MISLNSEQSEKIRLLDKFFNALSIEQIEELSESEQIVARLKGAPEPAGVLGQLVLENSSLSTDLMNLRSELYSVKTDFQTLVKLILKPYENNTINGMQFLKNRYGIY